MVLMIFCFLSQCLLQVFIHFVKTCCSEYTLRVCVCVLGRERTLMWQNTTN